LVIGRKIFGLNPCIFKDIQYFSIFRSQFNSHHKIYLWNVYEDYHTSVGNFWTLKCGILDTHFINIFYDANWTVKEKLKNIEYPWRYMGLNQKFFYQLPITNYQLVNQTTHEGNIKLKLFILFIMFSAVVGSLLVKC
jgi:hypothetical protein